MFISEIDWNRLKRLADVGNQMIGSSSEHKVMEAVRDALERVGARNAYTDLFEIQGWERDDSAAYAADTTQDCIAFPRSPAGIMSGELVDLGYGLAEDSSRDLSRKVAAVSTIVPDHYDCFIHRHKKCYYTVEAGATVLIFANHVPG